MITAVAGDGSAGSIRFGRGRPGPLLLAIETAGSGCSAAMLRGAQPLAAERRAMRHGHAEALLPMVERVAAEAGVLPANLDVVAVAIGPGGFTGIRAGMAAAQGIALAAGARLVGVSSFAAVAARAAWDGSGAQPGGGHPQALLVALDSRRTDLYVQLYAADGAGPLGEATAVLPDRLAAHVAELIGEAAPLLLAGDAAEIAAGALGGSFRAALITDSAPDALWVATAALLQLQTTAESAPVRPLYLRAPDVTLPKRRGRRPGPAT